MVDKEKILRFLQTHKFDLMREVPGFVYARVDDSGTKVVLRVSAPLVTPPMAEFEGEQIPFEVVADFPDAKPVDKAVVVSGPMNPVSVPPQPQEKIGTVALPEKVAIGPFEQGARNAGSYEAWVKRHGSRKVGG